MVVGYDNATGIGLDGSRKNDLRIGNRCSGAAGGHFKYTQDFISPVKQHNFELLYEFKLIIVPGLKQYIVSITGTGDLNPF